MLKKIALFSALAAIMGTTYAYKAEVGISYEKNEIFDEVDSKSIAVDGTYYLKSVELKNSPLNEAAFLERASNFNAKISHSDLFGELETDSFNLGLEYFAPNSNFYINANLGHAQLDVVSDKVKFNNYAVEVGYQPINGLLVAAGLAGVNFNVNNGPRLSKNDPTLRAKYVTTAGKYDVNVEAKALFADKTAYGVGADLYLDKTLSVGLGYQNQNHDITYTIFDFPDLDYFTVRAKKFFTPQISVEANVNFGGDFDGYALRAGYRF
ncbi:putative porin [Acinetobacter shaoyimingii]|uniref:Putative porin n=1 Tax=Acinetobacter shaoyimingii TaxID=2715164 RepID=A0A6G8RRU8_9GAMM|nr:putative porin [Acinetobacter shaoyimingii]QIO04631.1 putative porin [Acinetobacter shaoyimingii]